MQSHEERPDNLGEDTFVSYFREMCHRNLVSGYFFSISLVGQHPIDLLSPACHRCFELPREELRHDGCGWTWRR